MFLSFSVDRSRESCRCRSVEMPFDPPVGSSLTGFGLESSRLSARRVSQNSSLFWLASFEVVCWCPCPVISTQLGLGLFRRSVGPVGGYQLPLILICHWFIIDIDCSGFDVAQGF